MYEPHLSPRFLAAETDPHCRVEDCECWLKHANLPLLGDEGAEICF